MKLLSSARLAILAAAIFAAPLAAKAQSATPQQIQGMIAAGNESTALGILHNALAAHPDSGVAWFLTAEAQDASGHEDAARSALAKAEQYAPGLPFANPDAVGRLQAHLGAASPQSGTIPGPTGPGISPFLAIAGGLIVLFVLARMFFRRRRGMQGAPMYRDGFGAPFPGGPGGPMGYGPGGGYAQPQSGLGGTLLGGLAAGAGFAAGERVIDDMLGGGSRGNGQNFRQNFDNTPPPVPDRDDGLQGNPGWDDNSNQNPPDDSNFDPGNNW
jgi:hypothetical protein